MSNLQGLQLEAELGRVLVGELAPGELPQFGAMSRAFFADPKRAKPTRRGGDDVLGFGAVEAAGLLTPAVLSAACQVALYLTEELWKAFSKKAADLVAEEVKRLFRREPTAVRLDQVQLARIRAIALETARQFKLSNAKASQLADALVGHFALAPPV
jgi:hypothetical protein